MIPFASFANFTGHIASIGGAGTVFMCWEYKTLHGQIHTAMIGSDSGSNSALFIISYL